MSRTGRVVNGQITKASKKRVRPPPPKRKRLPPDQAATHGGGVSRNTSHLTPTGLSVRPCAFRAVSSPCRHKLKRRELYTNTIYEVVADASAVSSTDLMVDTVNKLCGAA